MRPNHDYTRADPMRRPPLACLLAGILFPLSRLVGGEVTIQPVALHDASAPGLPGDARFYSSRGFGIADPDHVAVYSEAYGSEGYFRGIWTGSPGHLSPLVLAGDPAPGVEDNVFVNFEECASVLRDGALMTVFAAHPAPTADSSYSHLGIWVEKSGSLQFVARAGLPVPGFAGTKFTSLGFSPTDLSASGSFIFRSRERKNSGGDSKRGLWLRDSAGQLTRLALEGASAPGGLMYQGVFSARISPSGDVLFGCSDPGQEAVWLHRGDETQLLIQSGQAAPGEPVGVTLRAPSPAGLNSAGHVAIQASLTHPADPNELRSALFAGPPSNLKVLVREGDAAPTPLGTKVFTSFPTYQLTETGSVVFLSQHADASSGLWSADFNGAVPMALVGSGAPGTDGAFTNFGEIRVNATGQVAFEGNFGALDDHLGAGVWAQDRHGVLINVVAPGDVVAVGGGETRTVHSAYLQGWTDGGALLLKIYFTTESPLEGVFLAQLPATEGPGTFGFSGRRHQRDEFSSEVQVTVTRAFGDTGAAVLHYTTMNDTATAGEDYIATSGDLSFADGEIRKTFTVPILNDSAIEDTESFQIKLTHTSGVGTLGDDTARVEIIDNDSPGALELVNPYVPYDELADESTGNLVLRVVRHVGSGGEVRVKFKAEVDDIDGQHAATPEVDFTPVSGELVFAPGVTEQTITIPLLDDDEIESSESILVTLFDPTGGATLPYGSEEVVYFRSDDRYEPTAAIYTGIFTSEKGTTAGTLRVKTTAGGAFTGTFRHGTKKHSFRGRFDSMGRATVWFPQQPGEPSVLYLQTSNSHRLTWSIDLVSQFAATRSPFHKKTNPLPWSTRYNLLMNGLGSEMPHGAGWATVQPRPDGTLKLVGRLADGTRISLSQRLTSADLLEFYIVLPRRGQLGGRLTFSGEDTIGRFDWVMSANRGGLLEGLTGGPLDVEGAPYVAPARGEYPLPNLVDTEGHASLTFFSSFDTETFSCILSPGPAYRAQITPENPGNYRVGLSFNATTGIYRGSYRFMEDGFRMQGGFSGVVLPAHDKAEGFGIWGFDVAHWRLR